LTVALERLADLHEEGRRRSEQDAMSRKVETAIASLNFRSRGIEMLEQDIQGEISSVESFCREAWIF
jgi:hypothetical protein